MRWIASFVIALLTSVVAMVGAAIVAGLGAAWYRMSSFEGASGFFVVGMAFFGLIGGFVIGLVVSRVEARRAQPRFVKALGVSCAVVGVILAVIAAASWTLADIPPEIDGEELFLLAEIRWPAEGAVAPDAMSVPYLRLGALSGSTVRKLENGLLFVEDARKEDGRSIVPGVVPIFTRRGGRLLDIGAGDKSFAGFQVPLPNYPGDKHRQWSAWLPTARPGDPALPDRFTYRFKVIRRSEPVRTETIGPFEVDTIADYFYNVSESDRLAAHATFRVRHKGQSIPGISKAETVAVVGGSKPALFLIVAEPDRDTRCALVIDEAGAVRVQPVGGCGSPGTARLLTSEQSRFTAAKGFVRVPGWIDRVSFAEPGLFQLHAAVIDTRNFTATKFLFPADASPNTEIPPLGLSPDERSFVWFVQGSDKEPRLGVTNWRTSRSYLLPIDRASMRYNSESSLDVDWVGHHFEWRHGAEGADVLVERPNFKPLPYRGDLVLGKPGEYQSYTLQQCGEPLRDAIVDVLIRDLGAERIPEESGGFRQRLRVKGKALSVSVIGTPTYLHVSMDALEGDPQLMSAVAATINAALATGRYDALLVAPDQSR
jgi:hypothetical protein